MKDKGKKLNWQQACEILGCGRTKFYDMVRSGIIPGYRAGRKGIWVYEDDTERALIMVSAMDASQKKE